MCAPLGEWWRKGGYKFKNRFSPEQFFFSQRVEKVFTTGEKQRSPVSLSAQKKCLPVFLLLQYRIGKHEREHRLGHREIRGTMQGSVRPPTVMSTTFPWTSRSAGLLRWRASVLPRCAPRSPARMRCHRECRPRGCLTIRSRSSNRYFRSRTFGPRETRRQSPRLLPHRSPSSRRQLPRQSSRTRGGQALPGSRLP